MKKQRLSILIITKKYTAVDISPEKANQLRCDDCDFEILIGEGDNPSLQRNHLAEKAAGDYLLFLDNDSEPSAELLSEYISLIKRYPECVIFGGPSLLKTDGLGFHEAQKIFFSSTFGIGPFKSRYNPLGKIRFTNEKELILSNILIQREYFIRTGGFNKELHPGEENEFLNRDKEAQVLYSPEAKIYRYPRENFKKFIYQIFSYGKGRAKHLLFASSELIFLLPILFSFYILLLLLLYPVKGIFIPFIVYLSFIVTVITTSRARKKWYPLCLLVFLAGHFFYGIGITVGLGKRLLFKKSRGLSYFNVIHIRKF